MPNMRNHQSLALKYPDRVAWLDLWPRREVGERDSKHSMYVYIYIYIQYGCNILVVVDPSTPHYDNRKREIKKKGWLIAYRGFIIWPWHLGAMTRLGKHGFRPPQDDHRMLMDHTTMHAPLQWNLPSQLKPKKKKKTLTAPPSYHQPPNAPT